MAKPTVRIAAIQFGFALGILAVLTRAAQLQIVEAEHWEHEAARQRTEKVVLPARRGALYDRNGTPLAITQNAGEPSARGTIASNPDGDRKWSVPVTSSSSASPQASTEVERRSGSRATGPS